MPAIPEQRTSGPYRIQVVCLGNICRSPTAEVVLEELLDRAGLASRVSVDSSGLGTWHVGEAMDRRSASELLAAGYDPSQHAAAVLPRDWAEVYDLVLAMDRSHVEDLREQVAHDPDATARVLMFRDFDPVDPGSDVPDPYYGGDHGFQEVLTMVERTSIAIVAALQRELADT
ncbi:MAG: low molecular weight protein-tyrosine-phosphatase [Nocardioidaceae bacterium]